MQGSNSLISLNDAPAHKEHWKEEKRKERVKAQQRRGGGGRGEQHVVVRGGGECVGSAKRDMSARSRTSRQRSGTPSPRPHRLGGGAADVRADGGVDEL